MEQQNTRKYDNLPIGSKIKTLVDIDYGRIGVTTSPCCQYDDGDYGYDVEDDIGQRQTISCKELENGSYYEILK